MTQKSKKMGRPSKSDKAQNCVMVRFTDAEYAEFLALHAKSGVKERAKFIKMHLFNHEFWVRTFDDNTMSFYQELKNIRAEVHRIGVNYNQLIASLRSHFTEQRAAIMSSKSAKLLSEILVQNEKAMQITRQLVRQWLPK